MKELYSVDDVAGFVGMSAPRQAKLCAEHGIPNVLEYQDRRGRPKIMYPRKSFLRLMKAGGWVVVIENGEERWARTTHLRGAI